MVLGVYSKVPYQGLTFSNSLPVCHNPCSIDSALLSRLISLWKLDALRPVEDGLARLVCPRNMLLLAQSNHPARVVWEKLADVVAAVLKANLVTADLVENQCLAIMQQEWPQVKSVLLERAKLLSFGCKATSS